MATCQDIVNKTLSIIGQPADSDIAALPSGDGAGDFTLTGTQGLINLINQGQNDLARQVMPILDTVNVTVEASAMIPPYNQLTTVGGRVPHRPVSITIGPYLVTPARYGDFGGWYSTPNPSTGAPQAWADLNFSAALSSPITQNTTFTIACMCLPVSLANLADNLDPFIDEEMLRLIAYWTAVNVVWSNTDYPDLQPRAQIWWQQFVAGRQMAYQNMLSVDPTLGGIFTPLPDIANALPNVAPKQTVKD